MGFQCSSASRKFLNTLRAAVAKNPAMVSVLFSEPKIPQLRGARAKSVALSVSVLFSEPKIPQCHANGERQDTHKCFSALQRAENSSI